MVNLQPESAEEAKALIPSLDVSRSAQMLSFLHVCQGNLVRID